MTARAPARTRPALALGTCLILAGCSMVGGGEPPAADLSGTYGGVLRLEGDEIQSTLRIEQDGGDVDATLDAPRIGFAASGSGRMSGTVLRVRLRYGDTCPGTMELAGQALDGGDRLAGTVEAEDCTGPATGSFSLTRR